MSGSADALKLLLLDLKKYAFSGYVRTIRVTEGKPSEGFVLVQAGNPVASFHVRGESEESGRPALKQVWQDSYDPTCSIELHARVDVDAALKEHPAGGLDRAKRLVRKAKSAEAPPREDLEARLKTWKEEGLEVRDLRAALAGDLDTARAAFAAYEENVKKIGLLREILRGLDTKGFEAKVTMIEEKLRDPRKHLAAEADVEELREAIEKARREAETKAVESTKEREVQERARQVFEMILKHRQEAGKAVEGITETAVMRAMEEKPTARDERTNLIRQFNFETFVVGPSNRFAHAASLAVSKSPHSAYNPLLITSGPGLGKTHLLNAIGNYIAGADGSSARVLYLSVEAFTNEMREAQAAGKMAEFREKYRGLDVFLLDDVHFLSGRGDVQEELFHTFNELYNAGKQIALTSDRPPKEIPDLEDRLVSRFESGLIADIQSPEYETRIAILRRRAKDGGVEVDEEVLATIAQLVPSNIRELGGALNRVLAFSSLMGEAVTLEMTREVLRDLTGGEPRRGKAKVEDAERVLKPGAAYLVKEERPTDCFRLFAKAASSGDGGLLITRSNPKRVREKFDLGVARILWLTDRESTTEDTIPPVLERIIYEIEEFMKKGSRGAVLIDGIEYLVSNNSFDAVLKFLRRLIDHVSETRFTFLLSLSPATMKEQEVKILEREMEVFAFG
ncbi:MAG TPA: DnaA/Hda family protein [Thermoplasmata archaeon]|nr:DnaA/Hda family protein [Thermoplasmata archaeon]